MRQVGPPSPRREISSPSYSSTSIAGGLEPLPGHVVAGEGESAAAREAEDVRAHRLELLVRHLDDADAARVEQLHERDRHERRVRDDELRA